MLIHEILLVKQPDVLCVLCRLFNIKELRKKPLHDSYFDPFWEMTHDSEGRYLDYSRAWK